MQESEASSVLERHWTYSHTQLDLWRLCKRKWWYHYVMGLDEPKTDAMAAGTWLVQAIVEGETTYPKSMPDWTTNWANFLAEFGGDDTYESKCFTPDLPKRVLEAYRKSPVQGKVTDIEHTFKLTLPGGFAYGSRPDLVVGRLDSRPSDFPPVSSKIITCFDIKLKTFNQSRAGDTWFAKAALSEFDDQGLGQAIAAGADAFGQIVFLLGKLDGTLLGPIYLEHPVNPVLKDEWLGETAATIQEIESWRKTTHASWPKNPASCHAFGRECSWLQRCQFGWTGVKS